MFRASKEIDGLDPFHPLIQTVNSSENSPSNNTKRFFGVVQLLLSQSHLNLRPRILDLGRSRLPENVTDEKWP